MKKEQKYNYEVIDNKNTDKKSRNIYKKSIKFDKKRYIC